MTKSECRRNDEVRNPNAERPTRRSSFGLRTSFVIRASTFVIATLPVLAAAASPDPPPRSDRPRYIGAAGCAAANCHGGGGLVDGRRNPLGSEYSYWRARDPHARAFAVLLEPASVEMVELLRTSPKYADLPPAHEAALCLTCHSVSPGSHDGQPNPHGLQGGVSCEGCHGAAEHWLAPHKRSDWKTLSPAEKQQFGFHNTKDLLARARICSQCHVGGDGGRDVNHDLIAAGHPRLAFEFAAYQANLPPHWNVETERRTALGGARRPAADVRGAYETKSWAVGQVAVARQALELLRLRAADAPQAVWPEFSELNCFDCHHRLEAGTWRQARSVASGRPPGTPSWGTWAWPLLPSLSAETAGPDLAAPDSPFKLLEREMIRPYPDQRAVRRLVVPLADQLDAWAADLNGRDDWNEHTTAWLVRLAADGQSIARRDWDGAAQTYLALAALAEAASAAQAGGPSRSILEPGLDTLREALRFEADPDAGLLNSPRDYAERVNLIVEELSRLQAELQATSEPTAPTGPEPVER